MILTIQIGVGLQSTAYAGTNDDSGSGTTTTDANGNKTTEYKVDNAGDAHGAGAVISVITMLLNVFVGLTIVFKCQAVWSTTPDVAIYAFGALAHIIAELVTMIVYTIAVKDKTQIYTKKVTTNTYGDYDGQIEALKTARDVNKQAANALIAREIITGVFTAVYAVAMVVLIVMIAKNKTPVYGWINEAVDNAKEAAAGAACVAASAASYENPKDRKLFLVQDDKTLFRVLESKGTHYFDKDSFEEKKPVANIIRSLEYQRYIQGKNTSMSIDDYEVYEEAFAISRPQDIESVSSIFKTTVNLFSQFVLASAHAAGETTGDSEKLTSDDYAANADSGPKDEDTANGQSFGQLMDSFGPSVIGIGAAAFMMLQKPVTAAVTALMVNPYSRLGYYIALMLIMTAGNVVLGVEQSKMQKRLKTYDKIIADLQKMKSDAANNDGKTTTKAEKTKHDRAAGDAEDKDGSKELVADFGACADANMKGDADCECKKTDSCYTLDDQSGYFSDLDLDLGSMKSIGSTKTAVDGLAKGKLSSSDVGGISSLNAAIRRAKGAQDEAEGMLEDHYGKPVSLDFRKGLAQDSIAAAVRKGMKDAGISSFKGMGFGNLLPEDEKIDPKKAKENLKKVIQKVESQGVTASAAPKLNFGFGKKKRKRKRKARARGPVDTAKELSKYEVDANDIHKDNRNLFDIIHNRYIKSYTKVFEKE